MSQLEQLSDGVTLYCGDNRDALRTLADCSVDSCVTDPPYALVSIVKRFAKENVEDVERNFVARKGPGQSVSPYHRAARGFMGKQWDTGEVAFDPEFWAEVLRVLKPGSHVVAFSGTRTYHRMASAIEDAGFEIRDQIGWTYGSGFPKSHNIGNGWGTALKPAWEPICLARKPLSEKTVATNVERWGVGAINVDGCRIEAANGDAPLKWETPRGGIWKTDATMTAAITTQDKGRFPANIIHDGSDEVLSVFPDAPGQQRNVGPQYGAKDSVNVYGDYGPRDQFEPRNDTGSAARFFYTAKADSDDRLGSKHPTVKPIDLMQWLVRLITPRGGTVLEPFAGTGTTAEAAFREGMRCILMEREAEYQDDIRRRVRLMMAGPDERARESIKAKLKDKPMDAGPLFGGVA